MAANEFDINPEILIDSEKQITVDVDTEGEKTKEKEQTKETEKEEKVETITVDENIEKKEDEDTEQSKEKENTSTSGESKSPITLHAAALHEKGILPELNIEEFDKFSEEEKWDKLFNAHQKEIKLGIEDYISQRPQELQFLEKNWREGVPLKELLEIRSDIIKYDNIKEEDLKDNEELCKSIVREQYKATTNFSDVKIEKEIKTKFDVENGEELALEGIKELRVIQKHKEDNFKVNVAKQKEKEIEGNKKIVEKIKKEVKETKEIIPGIAFTDDDKKYIEDTMIYVENVNGQPVSNVTKIRDKDPIGFEKKLRYYIRIGLFDAKPNFNKIKNVQETNIMKELEKSINRKEKSPSSTSVKVEKKDIMTIDDGVKSFLRK